MGWLYWGNPGILGIGGNGHVCTFGIIWDVLPSGIWDCLGYQL